MSQNSQKKNFFSFLMSFWVKGNILSGKFLICMKLTYTQFNWICIYQEHDRSLTKLSLWTSFVCPFFTYLANIGKLCIPLKQKPVCCSILVFRARHREMWPLWVLLKIRDKRKWMIKRKLKTWSTLRGILIEPFLYLLQLLIYPELLSPFLFYWNPPEFLTGFFG